MRRGFWIGVGVLLVNAIVLGGGWLATSPAPQLSQLAGLFTARSDESPIVVIVVGSLYNLARVREAIDADRVLMSSEAAFALNEERIVTVRVEDAGELLGPLGWTERQIEILPSPRRSPEEQAGEQEPPERLSYEVLSKQATLDAIEALALLGHLERRGDL